ncbi:MAG: class I SAM-dependent rRNA methyltransferase [Ignavibacteria bacterium]|nr:class I SAM-dependent rRNA methyltransferase [Ignavibacteria bacterium]
MEKQIVLKKNEERRLLNGHQWIFSNEIKSVNGSPDVGDVVELRRHDGRFLGIGFFNPHSLIAFRFLNKEEIPIMTDFFAVRIASALELRKRLFPDSDSYRVVYGESDFLPGLIVDKYGDLIALQILAAGMDKRLGMILDAIDAIFKPKSIVARNESPVRSLEHLPLRKETLRGSDHQTIISENGLMLKVDILEGQKTGGFLDQRLNRLTIRKYTAGARVLDCFCNDGGFALNALRGGAVEVTAIDISEAAIARSRVNTTLNHLNGIAYHIGDVFDELNAMREQKRQFDVVILDPPSFTRSKKTIATALKGYQRLNSLALDVIGSSGFLVTASCSHHITEEAFLTAVQESAHKRSRKIQLLELTGASPDHPVLPAMPETKYLKFAIFAVS